MGRQIELKTKKLRNGCIVVVSHKANSLGYPTINRNYIRVYAHRYVYEQNFGKIPDGLHVLHSCDNPPCVNPKHLSLGTHYDNLRDRDEKMRCVRGVEHPQHKLTEEQVIQIFNSSLTITELSKMYDIARKQIRWIREGKAWKHVTKDIKR